MTNNQTPTTEPTLPLPSNPDAPPISSPTPQPIVTKPHTQKNWTLPVIIILAILSLASIGTNIYFGIQNSSQSSEIANLKSNLDDQKDPQDQPTTPTDPETPDENNVSQILAQVPENLVIKSDDTVYTTSSALYKDNDTFAMSYAWNFYDNSGNATIYWDALANNLNYNNKTGTEQITDFGPTEGHVIDIIFGRFGNGFGYECFLFLMDDGTIEYVPYYLALKENNFRSRGKLENINGVIKFYNITNAHSSNGTGGYRTVLAQRADGTIYDLASTINSLVELPQ